MKTSLGAFCTAVLLAIAAFGGPAPARAADFYREKIQPIFDRRCVVCHACFTAPCQLNLSAYEGVDRGATKNKVYDSKRLTAVPPTRLFEDAQSTKDWQSRLDFFPVVRHSRRPETNLDRGILFKLLTQKAVNPHAPIKISADDEKNRSCPKNSAELDQYTTERPEGGMPYGFPALSFDEYETLTAWIRSGSPGPAPRQPRELSHALPVLEKWENFLNQESAHSRISSRYIYEHLFLAHVHFDELPGEFYRLVRSRSKFPTPVDEIATVRPFDPPGVSRVYYRFRKFEATPVRKNHIPYRLNDAKMRRYRELFLTSGWLSARPELPSYENEVAANPFIAFKDMPARARYQFLLDDAYYHVMTFIYGPVCKGNVALDVINEQFTILFLKPEADPTVTQPEFLPRVASNLRLPAQGENGLRAVYAGYKLDQYRYQRSRRKLYDRHASAGRELSDIWDGDGTNDSAILTVFRHHDSSDVLKGAHGGIPKTAWVLDYPIFERIYYDLVAGFDVYGNVLHQSSTRRYMDNLRIEAEDNFLTFLPIEHRKNLRNYWYRGAYARITKFFGNPFRKDLIETRIPFAEPSRSKEAFLRMVWAKQLSTQVRGASDPINDYVDSTPVDLIDAQARRIARKRGEFVQNFPDLALARVGQPDGGSRTYTIIRNKEHLNISSMFLEEHYREPEADDLIVLKGAVGSFPNFFFDVPAGHAERFFTGIRALKSDDGSFGRFVSRFGVRRMNPRFWDLADHFMDELKKERPIDSGVLDLSRYQNY